MAIRQIEHLLDAGPKSRFYELFSVAETLANPSVVFQGLERDGKEDALCYVGLPRQYGDGWEAPPRPGSVFLVCMTSDRVIFEWGWEKADELDNSYPTDRKRRFTTEIWKDS